MAAKAKWMEHSLDDGGGDKGGTTEPRIYDTRALFGRDREIVITHDGTDYRLRITRQNKLILNK